ncbi:MAG: PEGA domain-containing protein [Alistipes sp.]|nr:PEGA domain-containing protein [Alistipes sp.]
MKRFLFALLAVIMILPAMAEGPKRLINIDPASFQPVQKGALSGVNIDPIAKDRSQRACARIKLHINRMTREDIDQIVVYPIGGNIELTKKVTSYEGNGLILEMTAKPQTRFYIHHDKYGDSNEVMLNLEGNKEYYLEGHLDLLLPVTVATNVVGAEVFIDREFAGVTDENGLRTIAEVAPGKHSLLVVYENFASRQDVEVDSNKISFRLTINNTPTVAANTSATTLSPQLIAPEVKTYKVGDYYNDGKKEGVVFWVTDGGKHGKILSLTELWCQWTSDDYEQKRLIGADDKYNGANNMAKVKQVLGWESKYPAFKWCADMGEGWYLPAIEELKMFTLNEHVNNAVNRTLAQHSGTEVKEHYWSSSEGGYWRKWGSAWFVNMYNGGTYNLSKDYSFYARAVSAF